MPSTSNSIKRYTSIIDLMQDKEKERRKELESEKYNKEESTVNVTQEYTSLISVHNSSVTLLNESRKRIIEEKEKRTMISIEDLCSQFDLTLSDAFSRKETFDYQLTEEQIDKVNQILYRGDISKEYSNLGGYCIRLRDLQTLKDGCWLNDHIINICCELAMIKASNQKIQCHAFNSFFYKKLSENGYSGVSRWTRRIDLFSMKRVIIPINKSNTHWTMAYIDMEKKEIHYCDSMAGRGDHVLNTLLNYLKEELNNKKGEEMNKSQWSLVDHRNEIPQQQNCTDCGVFTIMNCILSCLKLPYNYSQKDIPSIRKYLVHAIVNGELLCVC